MHIQGIIFDWAGTTVDFGCCGPIAVIRSAFLDHGIDVPEAIARGPMGMFKRDHVAAVIRHPHVEQAWLKLHGTQPGEAEIDRVYGSFLNLLGDSLREHAGLIPGVLETVKALRGDGLAIGSTTGYTRDMLQPILELAAAQGYAPDCVVTPEEVGRGRPAPLMIVENLTRLNLWPPCAVVKVGDTPSDVREGLNAGTWSVGVAGTGNGIGMPHNAWMALSEDDRQARLQLARRELAEAGAHFVIDTLVELPAVLDRVRSTAELPAG